MPVLDQVLCVHETELTSVSPTVKYWSTEHSRRPGTARTTFTSPDLTTFTRLDELGLVVVGQRLDAGRVVLAC